MVRVQTISPIVVDVACTPSQTRMTILLITPCKIGKDVKHLVQMLPTGETLPHGHFARPEERTDRLQLFEPTLCCNRPIPLLVGVTRGSREVRKPRDEQTRGG